MSDEELKKAVMVLVHDSANKTASMGASLFRLCRTELNAEQIEICDRIKSRLSELNSVIDTFYNKVNENKS